MARNGSGTYVAPAGQPVTTQTTIDSTVFNNLVTDIGTELTNSIARDGQSPPTANLPMGGFRHTGAGTATARTMLPLASQVQDDALIWGGTAGGTANAITITTTPATTAHTTGAGFLFKAAATNTGSTTIAPNGLSAQFIVRAANGVVTNLGAGDILIGNIYRVVYDGTNYYLTSFTSTAGNALVGSVIQQNTTSSSAVTTGTTLIPVDDTIPQNTEGFEVLSRSITPFSTANILEIQVVVNLASNTVTAVCTAALFQDSTANALAAAATCLSVTNSLHQITFTYHMNPATVNATTFKVRIGANIAATVTFNGQSAARIFGGVISSRITIKEYKG